MYELEKVPCFTAPEGDVRLKITKIKHTLL